MKYHPVRSELGIEIFPNGGKLQAEINETTETFKIVKTFIIEQLR